MGSFFSKDENNETNDNKLNIEELRENYYHIFEDIILRVPNFLSLKCVSKSWKMFCDNLPMNQKIDALGLSVRKEMILQQMSRCYRFYDELPDVQSVKSTVQQIVNDLDNDSLHLQLPPRFSKFNIESGLLHCSFDSKHRMLLSSHFFNKKGCELSDFLLNSPKNLFHLFISISMIPNFFDFGQIVQDCLSDICELLKSYNNNALYSNFDFKMSQSFHQFAFLPKDSQEISNCSQRTLVINSIFVKFIHFMNSQISRERLDSIINQLVKNECEVLIHFEQKYYSTSIKNIPLVTKSKAQILPELQQSEKMIDLIFRSVSLQS